MEEKEVLTMRGLDYTALTIVIIGAVNWGLIGFFSFDLVAFIFGNMSWISRIVYGLVGICGLYLISLYGRISDRSSADYYEDSQPNRCEDLLLAK